MFNNKYQVIQLCKKCKSATIVDTVKSEYRIKPVYKIGDDCDECPTVNKSCLTENN
jgi:hypothetical protein